MENNEKPLAVRMRPKTLDEFLGQEELVGQGKLLRQAIESDSIPSMIFGVRQEAAKLLWLLLLPNRQNQSSLK